MGRLTTHVLDTAAGVPAQDMKIELHRLDGGAPVLIATQRTNVEGRTATPLLDEAQLDAGTYSLTFHVAPYFRGRGVELPDPPFLDLVVVHFGVADASGHYHVPLLVSPWSYSTYRGS